MFRSFSLAVCFLLTGGSLIAQDKELSRLENAGLVMEEFTAREIVRGTGAIVPVAGRRLVDVLQKRAVRSASTAAR